MRPIDSNVLYCESKAEVIEEEQIEDDSSDVGFSDSASTKSKEQKHQQSSSDDVCVEVSRQIVKSEPHPPEISAAKTPPMSPKPLPKPLEIQTSSYPEFTELEISAEPSPRVNHHTVANGELSNSDDDGSVDLQISELPPGFEDDHNANRPKSPEAPLANPIAPPKAIHVKTL